MVSRLLNSIPVFFYVLFFFVPIILFPKTSELFEFNKLVLTYALTTLIVSLWLTKMVFEKRIIFRRTILDIPLLIFLAAQLVSSVTSVDIRTSIFGYYSRFHGGLLSSISYSLLYWAYVANLDKEKTLKSIRILLASAVLVSIYGVAEHFGIDKDIWVQDVQSRVFSTLGQPNWLAAWLVALTPLAWALGLNGQSKIKNFWTWLAISSLFFLTLLYTGSRSGILGFVIAYFIFWLVVALQTRRYKELLKTRVKKFLIFNFVFLIVAIINGTQWTPSIKDLLTRKTESNTGQETSVTRPVGPALEVGGTESGQIRKIVWKGAVDVWKNYPILGSGVETFAFSYYNFRPVEHNLVSEWNYLYNKAHNEYLNIAATTGTLGLLSYLILIGAIILQITKGLRSAKNEAGDKIYTSYFLLLASLQAGFASILVTNFFGFTVIPVALQFFLYPAIAVSLQQEGRREKEQEIKKTSQWQTLGILILISFTLLFLYSIAKYWYADYLYAKGTRENDSQNFAESREILTKATKLSSHESIFWEELSEATTEITLALEESGDEMEAQEVAKLALAESNKAVSLSPANVNLKRKLASNYIKLSGLNPEYLILAQETLSEATQQAPTDAQLFYNLALSEVRLGERKMAVEILEKTIEMKKDYADARFALALLLIDEGETERAKEELRYMLKYISPNDPRVLKELEELESGGVI